MTTEATNSKKPIFYHQQRIFWPLVSGFAAFLLWHNQLMPGDNAAIPAFIAYVIVGLFYDWLIFNYFGYKDSSKLSAEQWQEHNVTPEQYDKLNEFYVMVRRCAVAASVSAAAMCALFFPQASLMGSFTFAYVGITILLISIGVLTKDIVFRYSSNEVWVPSKNKNFITSNPEELVYFPTGSLIDPSGRVINTNH